MDPQRTDALVGQNFVFGTRSCKIRHDVYAASSVGSAEEPSQHVKALIGAAYGEFAKIPEAMILAFNAPAIRGLGATGGFSAQVQDPSRG